MPNPFLNLLEQSVKNSDLKLLNTVIKKIPEFEKLRQDEINLLQDCYNRKLSKDELPPEINMNYLDQWGYSILETAIDRGKVTIVEAILDAKANPNIENPRGEVPLIHAMGKDPEITRSLLKAKADPNRQLRIITDVHGHRLCSTLPLLEAAASNSPKIVEFLLEYKADVDIVQGTDQSFLRDYRKRTMTFDAELKEKNKGNTALILAVNNKSHEMIKLIVNAKANLEMTNDDKQTALDLCYFDLSIANLLLSYRARIRDPQRFLHSVRVQINNMELFKADPKNIFTSLIYFYQQLEDKVDHNEENSNILKEVQKYLEEEPTIQKYRDQYRQNILEGIDQGIRNPPLPDVLLDLISQYHIPYTRIKFFKQAEIDSIEPREEFIPLKKIK